MRQTGFSLVELAMVLFIISLVLGGLLVPLASQLEVRQRSVTLDGLERIKESLIGFAMINGRLPCPTTETDPSNANYGREDTVCSAPTAEGYLPWMDLGVDEYDPWGTARLASTDPMYGRWRYRVDRRFSCDASPCTDTQMALADVWQDNLDVQDENGNALTSTSEPPVAIIYSTGENQTADGANATWDTTYQGGAATSSFDDIVVWVTRPLLFSRMVAAGTLP